ncbi:MAG: hypothetical protein V5A88_02670 [Candidatus Thermoplasmatota archaeon]
MVSEVKESSPGMKDTDISSKGYSDDPTQEVIKHLTFHKSIIDEERNGERINEYIGMIEELEEDGQDISDDPFENAIASIFKLVIEERMDPWEIDLISFTEMYLSKARKKENLNFIVAGRLVNMAWSILKMQCEHVLNSAEDEKEEEAEEPVEEEFFNDWDVWDQDVYEEPEDIDYEEKVLEDDETPLKKAVRREEKKPVSLMQLVDAFEDAKKEAKYKEKMERIRKEKKKEREEEFEKQKENYKTRSHKENLQRDISLIWDRICCYEQNVITLNMIHDNRKKDIITALISVLFLHKKKKIKLNQLEYPDGQILLENLVPEEKRENGLIDFVSEEEQDAMTLDNVIIS